MATRGPPPGSGGRMAYSLKAVSDRDLALLSALRAACTGSSR